MKYKFLCPQCEQRISADSGVQGSIVNCPTCAVTFTAPPFVKAPPIPLRARAPEDVEEEEGEEEDDFGDSSDQPWRAEAATDRQKNKLKFFGVRLRRGLTKGEASELIDAAMEAHPEIEAAYQAGRTIRRRSGSLKRSSTTRTPAKSANSKS